MKLRQSVWLLMLALPAISLSAKVQSRTDKGLRADEPKTVTLFSRAKYKDEFDGSGKSSFSFRNGARSDGGREITHNNYDLQYGNITVNGDSDWFLVTMATDDCSRIKDLGELKWYEIAEISVLPASVKCPEGIRISSKTETSPNVSRVVAGHAYVVHTKDRESNFYTLFRVDNLAPNDQVTISWKLVPSPQK